MSVGKPAEAAGRTIDALIRGEANEAADVLSGLSQEDMAELSRVLRVFGGFVAHELKCRGLPWPW